MKLWFKSITAAIIGLLFPLLTQAANYPEVTFILDSSGSMYGKVGNHKKIEAAKMALTQIVPKLPLEVSVGLVAYGHRQKGDCDDIEILIPSGSKDRQALLNKVKALHPKGKTPITRSVATVVEQLKTKENETTIVLVSDGIETCAADPCKAINDLKATGIKFIMHVVGFGVNSEGSDQLMCIAEAAGGQYLAAQDIDSLLTALNTVSEEIDKKIKIEKAQATKTKVSTGLGKLKLTMPPSTTRGMVGLKIIRSKDNKVIKTTERLGAESKHPLMAGRYQIEYLFATPNYGEPTTTKLGKITVTGGQTKEIKLGGIVFNLADSLQKTAVDQVLVTDSGSGNVVVTVNDNGNGYYNFKPKAVLPGKYDIKILYSNSPVPTVIAKGLLVKPGEETVVTLDSGLAFKEVKDTDISGWDLIPLPTAVTVDQEEDGDQEVTLKPLLQARPPSGNKSTLWTPYIVPPGKYKLMVHVNGMDEPLPVTEDLKIESGQMLIFDSGL